MSVTVLAAVETAIPATDTYVSSAQAFETKVFLSDSFAEDAVVRIESTSTAPIVVCDAYGRKIGTVPTKQAALVSLRTTPNLWQFFLQPTDSIALQVVPASPGAGYVQAEAVAVRTAVVAMQAEMTKRGWFKAE